MKRQVFVQGPLTCIDEVAADGLGMYSRETLAQVQARYPGAEIADLATWCRAKEAALCADPPKEITADQFIERLDCLPPQRWQRAPGCESFEICEHLSGRVTTVCVRVGKRHWEFNAVAGQPIGAHVARCLGVEGVAA